MVASVMLAPEGIMQTTRRLDVALGLLTVLQVLHLLDGLRTDPSATFPRIIFEPQAIAGVGGSIVALVLVARGHAWGRPLAILSAVLVSLGFAIVHGLPFSSELTTPYWGEGSADGLQWLGVVAIWACSAVVVLLARRRVVTT